MSARDNARQKRKRQVGDEVAPKLPRTGWRAFRIGCLSLLLVLCGLISSLIIVLQDGPVILSLPALGTLKIGSDDFVLSNFSFQNGTTYYLDLNGNGVRNILELDYLNDSRTLQLNLHHSTKGDREENRLLEMKLP